MQQQVDVAGFYPVRERAITVPQSKTTVFEYRVLQIGSQMSFDVSQAESKHDHVCESQTYLAVDSQRFVADEEGFSLRRR